MSMILPMAPMPLEHHNGAALAGTATHPSADSLQARAAPSHASAQQAPGILLAGGASQGGDRQDTRTIDDALGQPPADLATPVGDVDLGPPQAPRRLRRFLKKNFLIQGVGTGLIKMSYLGNTRWRSKRASTACIAVLPSAMPFW